MEWSLGSQGLLGMQRTFLEAFRVVHMYVEGTVGGSLAHKH